jgi:hypothetical protein
MHSTPDGRIVIPWYSPTLFARLRTDLVEGCRGCPYARKVLGDRALQSEFPIVVARHED